MADEIDTQSIVESISGLTKTTERLVSVQKAEGDKAKQDRKKTITELEKQSKAGDGRKKGVKQARAAALTELKKIEVSTALDKAVNEEMSRSVADSLNINLDELQLRKDQKQALDNQKAALGKLEEAIKAAGGDPAQNAEFQRRTLAFQDAEKAQQAQSRTTEVAAGELEREKLEAMKVQLEKNGQVATDSKEFNKLSYEIEKAALQKRFDEADSPAARKEIRDQQRQLAAKQEGLLGKIAGGINSLRDSAKEKLKSAGKGIMALLSGFAIAGFALALVAFLNSKFWQDTKTYIIKTLLPKLEEFYNAFFGEGGGFMKGISALFGDDSGIGSIVLGIGAAAALFAAFKFAKLLSAVKGLLGGVGGFAKKLTGIGGKGKGVAGAVTPAGGKVGAAKRVKGGKGAGAGVGKALGNIGKGLGKGLSGILRGIAGGLMAFANPAVAIGAAAFAAAIVLVGGAVAGAAYLLGKAMPTLRDGFKSFEDLNGAKLSEVGLGMAAIGGGMAAFGAGKAVEGVGGLIGSIGGFFSGKDKLTPLQQLKIFSETPINAVQATANANALVEYSKAMAAAGGAGAVTGISDFIGGTLGSLGNFFGGEKETPLQQLVKFGNTAVNSAQVVKNAKALGDYSAAMSVANKANPTAGQALGSFVSGALGSLTSFFGGDSPLEKLKKFGEMDISATGVIKNATAMSEYTKALGGLSKVGKTEIELFTDSVVDMKEAIDSLSNRKTTRGLKMFSNATRILGSADIKKLNEDGLSIPVNVVGKTMVEMSAGLGAAPNNPVIINAPSTISNSTSSSSSSFTNTSMKNEGSAGKLAAAL